MFCPTCGKENSAEIKYCASCGTNLEAVSNALTGIEENFFTRIDGGIDQLFARYSEHVFKPHGPTENSVARSWKLLGQGVATSFLDLILFVLMWNILPLRLLLLLISTPFRLLSERSPESVQHKVQLENYKPPELAEPVPGQFLSGSIPSVVEDTTTNLKMTRVSKKTTTPITDKLE